MLKALAIVTVLVFGLALYVAVQNEYAARQTEQQSGQPPKATIPTNAHDNHSQENAENANGNFPRWYRFFAWPDGVTAWAIILTLLAIVLQTNESARATRAMRDSVRIQEAEFLQWVAMEDWIFDSQPSQFYSDLFNPGAEKPREVGIEMNFAIANNSQRPLTIRKVETRIQLANWPTWRVFTASEARKIPPHGKHGVHIEIALCDPQLTLWWSDELYGSVGVEVSYENALGGTEEWSFPFVIKCGRNGSFLLTAHYSATETLPKDDQGQ